MKMMYNIAKIIRKIWRKILYMKKVSAAQRAFNSKKSEREMRRRRKKNKRKSKYSSAGIIYSGSMNAHSHRQVNVKAPTMLSLLDFPDETLRFFKDIFSAIRSCSMNDRIFFDLAAVEKITADAVMYIIALIRNVRRANVYHLACLGNNPVNPDAKEMLEKVGFYRYVESIGPKSIISQTSNIQISSGRDVDSKFVGEICDFVHRVCKSDHCSTKKLYQMIVELMTNTRQHAYNLSSAMVGNWYIYAENKDDYIQFVFLDTGVGIPVTVARKISEKIKDFFAPNDAAYIASALRGESRTETKQPYRGKGLPGIYKDVCSGNVSNFVIISGNGECRVDHDGGIKQIVHETELQGTLFCWTFSTSEGGKINENN